MKRRKVVGNSFGSLEVLKLVALYGFDSFIELRKTLTNLSKSFDKWQKKCVFVPATTILTIMPSFETSDNIPFTCIKIMSVPSPTILSLHDNLLLGHFIMPVRRSNSYVATMMISVSSHHSMKHGKVIEFPVVIQIPFSVNSIGQIRVFKNNSVNNSLVMKTNLSYFQAAKVIIDISAEPSVKISLWIKKSVNLTDTEEHVSEIQENGLSLINIDLK